MASIHGDQKGKGGVHVLLCHINPVSLIDVIGAECVWPPWVHSNSFPRSLELVFPDVGYLFLLLELRRHMLWNTEHLFCIMGRGEKVSSNKRKEGQGQRKTAWIIDNVAQEGQKATQVRTVLPAWHVFLFLSFGRLDCPCFLWFRLLLLSKLLSWFNIVLSGFPLAWNQNCWSKTRILH